jgi:hypothetical protein
MKLKGKRSKQVSEYDAEVGAITDNYMINYKGGGGSTTTTGPSPEQRRILNMQMGYARQMEGLGDQQFYGGSTLAERDAASVQGLEAQRGAAGSAGALADTAADRFQDAMAYDPMNDPRTGEYLDALTNPMMKQFNEETIPGLNTAAVNAGAFGGDRAALLKSSAAGELASSIGDTRTKALQGMVDANRAYQGDMFSQLGSLQDASLKGSQILRDVGAGYEGYDQAEIDAARERFEFEQDAPRQSLRDASSMLSGIDFGSISKTTGGGK